MSAIRASVLATAIEACKIAAKVPGSGAYFTLARIEIEIALKQMYVAIVPDPIPSRIAGPQAHDFLPDEEC